MKMRNSKNCLKACTPAEQIRFKFYLMSGFRDAEGRFVTWRDVDFKHLAVRVTAKPRWGFHPKNWEEREVPVPKKLIAMLRKFRPTTAVPDDPLFPCASGKPDGAMLEKLKAVAYRAKLNCGHCVVKHELRGGHSQQIGALTDPSALVGSFTNSATPTPQDIFRTELTSALYSNFDGSPPYRVDHGLLKGQSGTATFRPEAIAVA